MHFTRHTSYYKRVSRRSPLGASTPMIILAVVLLSSLMVPASRGSSPAGAVSYASSPLRLLVVPVEFPDQPHVKAAAEIEHLVFYRLSLYLGEASYGRVRLEGSILDWVKAPRKLSFYGCDEGGIDRNVPVLVRHAVHLASRKPGIRIDDYDLILIVHAGQGQETSGRSIDIWSAYWTGLDIKVRGISVESAVILPEYEGGGVDLLGPYAHEVLHALGLQDVGGVLARWDVMGRAAYYGDPPGSSPAHPTAYNKIRLGWISPSDIAVAEASASSEVVLSPIESASSLSSASVLKIPLKTGSYYLVEFRSRIGFDRGLPSPALLITLVEEGKGMNEWKVSLLPLNEDLTDPDGGTLKKSLSFPLGDDHPETIRFADEENNLEIQGTLSPEPLLIKIRIGAYYSLSNAGEPGQ
ncbi:MAG: hypothetical protein QW638_08575 [Candidatus Bathyarchaeia archaeon]